MNISYAQAIALGGPLAEEARRLMGGDRRQVAPVEADRSRPKRGPNKTEQRFHDEILPIVGIGRIRYELIKFKLAGNTFYTPDFVIRVFGDDGQRMTCVEIKGHMRDDAAVKLKTAASLYPEFWWLLVRAVKGGWDVRQVDDRGIGRERITVSWIPGSA